LDVLSSTEKPWALRATPEPSASSDMKQKVLDETSRRVQLTIAQINKGQDVTGDQIEQLANDINKEFRDEFDFELTKRTKSMETKIHDQMVQGGWDEAFVGFVSDLVTLKCGIIKGPIPRIRKKKEWTWDEAAKKNQVKVVDEVVPEFERVSPFDFFPSPDAVGINDGSLVERIKFTRRGLLDLKDQPGYDADAIDAVLTQHSESQSQDVVEDDLEQEREAAEIRDPDDEHGFSETIMGMEYWCSAQGSMLLEHGMEKDTQGKALGEIDEYEINAIVVADHLIYVDFNKDPLGERPYSKTGWAQIPGSFWAQGVPELMADIQRVCNASARALVNNMAIASGPQAEVDVGRLVPGEVIESIRPHKVWQTTNKGNNASRAVTFFQPSSNASELMGVYDRFAQLADDYTGIPAYAYGNDRVAGAGRTSSGLSMLMSAAAKGIKRVLLDVEKNIIRSVIKRQFEWNKQYLGPDFVGDVDVIPTGVVAIMIREQMSDRRTQFLQSTANDFDMRIVGLKGRAAVLRETAETLEIPGKELTLSDEELRDMEEQDEKQQQQQQQEQLALVQAQRAEAEAQLAVTQQEAQLKAVQAQSILVKAQVDMQKAEIEKAKLQLEIQKLQLDAQKAGVELDLKAEKISAEAIKDRAVAADLGVQNLVAPENPGGAESPRSNLKGVETKSAVKSGP